MDYLVVAGGSDAGLLVMYLGLMHARRIEQKGDDYGASSVN